MGRLTSTNIDAYYDLKRSLAEEPPFCETCKHRDTKADIDTREAVRQLLYDADLYEPLDAANKDALTDW